MTQEKLNYYIQKANEIHNNQYDYSLVKDVETVRSSINIICPIHGVFTTSFDNHINKKTKCPSCSNVKKYTNETFIEKLKSIHFNSDYDYSYVDYKNAKTKVKIYCNNKDCFGNDHGIFEMKATHLISGHGCPKCSNRNSSLNEKIYMLNEVHKNKYDYSLIKENIKSSDIIEIICHEKDEFGEEHGVFKQQYSSHLSGCGCPKCNKGVIGNKDEFVKKANLIHNNFYSYDKFEYVNARTKGIITCPKHGDFLQSPDLHVRRKHSCPKCKSSILEKELIELFNINKILFDYQVYFNNLGKQTIDFKIGKIYIECQGEQHYVPINFGGDNDIINTFEKRKELDKQKFETITNDGNILIYYTKPQYFDDKSINIYNDFYKDKIIFTDEKELLKFIKENIS